MSKALKYLKIVLIILIFGVAIYQRIGYFPQTGKDIYAYEKAVNDLWQGINPYIWTVHSYEQEDPSNHGFAYFPVLLYIYFPMYVFSKLTLLVDFVLLWKIPILLADIGVGVLLIKLFKKKYIPLILGLFVWFFNPYFYMKTNYVYTDPLPIFFMFLSLYVLGKKDGWAGFFYALSVGLKTFPYLIFPVMLLKAKDKKKFLLWGLFTGFLISIPFFRSWYDFTTYLQGTLGVHTERYVQGRPFLFYISYFYDIELFQIIPFNIYTTLASFSGWVLVLILYFWKKIKDTYILSVIPFVTFYLFTPVLNRTYTMWFLPLFITACLNLSKKNKYIYYVLIIGYYAFYYWYLAQWKDGFHIWRP